MPTFRPEFFLLDSRALQSADARAIVHGASRAELATLCVLLAHESGGDRSQSDLLGQHRERSRVQFGTEGPRNGMRSIPASASRGAHTGPE